MRRLTIGIDRDWSTNDFIEYFSSLTKLYRSQIFIDFADPDSGEFIDLLMSRDQDEVFAKFPGGKRSDPTPLGYPLFLQYLSGMRFEPVPGTRTMTHHDLVVDQIQFASPGPTDFLGVASAIEKIFGVVGKLITWRHDRDMRHLDKEMRVAELQSMNLDNLEKSAALLEKYGYQRHHIEALLEDQLFSLITLDDLVEDDRIVKVSLEDHSDDIG